MDVNLDGGNVKIIISGEDQTFSFISGVGCIGLPQFSGVFSDFYRGKSGKARLDNYGIFNIR